MLFPIGVQNLLG